MYVVREGKKKQLKIARNTNAKQGYPNGRIPSSVFRLARLSEKVHGMPTAPKINLPIHRFSYFIMFSNAS